MSSEVQLARERTVTALLLLAVGAALSWIPYVGALGGLLILIGLIMLFVGRHGFGATHHRYVILGSALYILAFLAAIVLAVDLAASVVNAAVSSQGNATALRPVLESQLGGLAVGLAVVGVLQVLSQAVIVYGLADGRLRPILILAVVTGVIVNLVLLYWQLPLLSHALDQATSGPSFDSGPVNDAQNQLMLLGAIRILPAALFAWAYYQIRESIRTYDAAP